MARIFDNIDNDLLTTLRATEQMSQRSFFFVGTEPVKLAAQNKVVTLKKG